MKFIRMAGSTDADLKPEIQRVNLFPKMSHQPDVGRPVPSTTKDLQDLLLYRLSGSYRLHSLVISDYEILKQLYQKAAQSNTYDSLFASGKNHFYMNDFEKARESLVGALKLRPDDPTCLIWLGVVNLYLGVRVSRQIRGMTNKMDTDYKTLVTTRDRIFGEACKLLSSKIETLLSQSGCL